MNLFIWLFGLDENVLVSFSFYLVHSNFRYFNWNINLVNSSNWNVENASESSLMNRPTKIISF